MKYARWIPALFVFLVLLVSGVSAAQADEPVRVGYDKGFFISDSTGDFKLKIFGHFQFRFAYQGRESRQDQWTFRIPRGRLKFKGNLFNPDFKFGLHVAYDRGTMVLKDYFIDYTFVPGWLRVRAGQHKRPYSRQYILSGHYFQFIERGISHGFSNAGRDLGISFHNGWPTDGLEWAAGVYNGPFADVPVLTDSGAYRNNPSRFEPMVVARLAYNYGGIKAYHMGDLEGGPFRFAVGINGQAALDADNTDQGVVQTGVDAIMKIHGFALDGAFYMNWDQSGDTLADLSREGYGGYAAASYHFAPWVLPGIRYHAVKTEQNDTLRHEIEGVLNVLFYGHRLKLQVDGAGLLTDAAGSTTTDWRTRAQINVVF